MDLTVRTLEGKESGTIALSEEIFALTPREDILQRVVRWQLARRQQGTHQAQNRSTISRTGAKMYKQKGGGRARHSSARAPQFRGGGKAHGPVVRDHAHSLTKKFRALGLRHALSAKMRSNDIIVVDDFVLSQAKTKILSENFAKLGFDNALLVAGKEIDTNFQCAISNIPNVAILAVQGINVYDILRRHKLVLSKAAVEAIEERLK